MTGCYEAVQKAIQKQKAIPLVRLGCKVELEELTAAEATTTVEAAYHPWQHLWPPLLWQAWQPGRPTLLLGIMWQLATLP